MRVLWLVVLLCSCAHGPPRATSPVRQLSDENRAQLANAPQSYGTGASTPKELGQKFETGLRTPCTHDDRLDVLAEIIAETMVSTTQLPARSLTQWLMWRGGVVGQLHAVQAWNAQGDAELLLEKAMIDYAGTIAPDPRGAPLHYGVARVLHAFGSEWGQVVVLSAVPLELDALPKRVAKGAKVELTGRFRIPAFKPKLYIDDSDSAVREVDVQPAEDGTFKLTFDAPKSPGRRFIEVSAFETEETPEHPQWMRSLLMLPLHVDVPEATEPDDVIRTPAPNPAALGDWGPRALALYNQRRSAAGLGALSVDPIAQGLAAEGAKALAADEDAPPDAHLIPRLSQAGLPTRNAQQHAGRVEFLDESTVLSLYSPSLRQTLMDPAVTAVGIAYEPVPADPKTPTVHQVAGAAVFAAPVGTLDPHAEETALVAGLNAAREKAGRKPLLVDREFSDLAHAHAKTACAGQPATLDATSGRANQLGFTGGLAMTFTVTRLLPSDLRHEEKLLAAEGTHVAVGVCQGPFEGQPRAERVVFFISTRVSAPTAPAPRRK